METDKEAIQDSLLQSALTDENRFQNFSQFDHWLIEAKKRINIQVKRIPFSDMQQWSFNDEGNLAHQSGRFFSIEGISVDINTSHWDQPIINQPEIGLLGIISKSFDGVRYFLMQAKVEPGNIGMVQISPTVQATRSNMNKVHGGGGQTYVDFFNNDAIIITDQLQAEQGGRFYKKQNRNVIIDVIDAITVQEDFCWLTLKEIRNLLERDNLINMDARSVLSCLPYFTLPKEDDPNKPRTANLDAYSYAQLLSMQRCSQAHHSLEDIFIWFADIKKQHSYIQQDQKKTTVNNPLKSLHTLHDWVIGNDTIYHKKNPFFTVIAVRVKANHREVTSWDQPLIREGSLGLLGFISKNINGVLHFLLKAKPEIGNRDLIELAPTVSCANYIYRQEVIDQQQKNNIDYPFLSIFINPPVGSVRYESIQSEEGGRFYHFQNKNIILELDDMSESDIPKNYCWLTLFQLEVFQKKGYLNIDSRTLLASLSLRCSNNIRQQS